VDFKESGLIVGKIMHNLYNGSFNAIFNESELADFKNKLIALILNIGITNDLQGELGNLEAFPL